MSQEIPVAVAAPQVAPAAGVVPLPRARPAVAAPAVAEEQLAYARLLDRGMKVGLLALTASFLVYVSGALQPRVPVADLPRYWSLPVKEYLAATGIHPGWGWLALLGHGDFLNFLGIAFLSGVTIACYLAIIPILFRKKDAIYGWIAVAEVLVLALAASGVLNAGAH
ncbi:MAG TPA: hypothetical protein VFL83_01510 [Anaeromyxobacter sp.]|nr:hypothetical protein [Anaeromyxobacter sp.]